MDAPVLLILYKRPETTRRVFAGIREARPARLYIAGNAPASNDEQELVSVQAARAIAEEVDWPCEVKKLFRTEHLRAKESITSSISWFLREEPEGIILEDDCVVSADFFGFAAAMLERYRDDERVFQISASNFQDGNRRGDGDYYFSRYNHIWGWATWARAWRHADVDLKKLDVKRFEELARKMIPRVLPRKYWMTMFRYIRSGKIDTYDYQWMISMWLQDGMSIIPNANLVTNIGFGDAATNTTAKSNPWANMAPEPLPGPWRAPSPREVNTEADRYTLDMFFGEGRPWWFNVLRLKAVSLMSPQLKRKLKQRLAGK
jgi:hypothetical protein